MNRPIKFRVWNKHTLVMRESPSGYNALAPKDFIWMQFTGLLDKNGKEIYEGDIVTDTFEKREIIFDKEMACFVGKRTSDGDVRYLYNIHYWKVLGNIFEHPELSEAKE